MEWCNVWDHQPSGPHFVWSRMRHRQNNLVSTFFLSSPHILMSYFHKVVKLLRFSFPTNTLSMPGIGCYVSILPCCFTFSKKPTNFRFVGWLWDHPFAWQLPRGSQGHRETESAVIGHRREEEPQLRPLYVGPSDPSNTRLGHPSTESQVTRWRRAATTGTHRRGYRTTRSTWWEHHLTHPGPIPLWSRQHLKRWVSSCFSFFLFAFFWPNKYGKDLNEANQRP